jgi:hypothetical protein
MGRVMGAVEKNIDKNYPYFDIYEEPTKPVELFTGKVKFTIDFENQSEKDNLRYP